MHAGLNPTRRLNRQRIVETMNLRSVDLVNLHTISMASTEKETDSHTDEDKRWFAKDGPLVCGVFIIISSLT